MKKIHVRYYALLREQAGKSEESLATEAGTPAALFSELHTRYPFTLSMQQLKVAINAEFRDWQTQLKDGDSVVFIPPVAGG
ncbi:MAG: MoaD/ThiS family protein [Candidatus Obscuribacterales bacterium]|nr:MoaD/ThiS family protein [Steroidobacteraceae bacterium]